MFFFPIGCLILILFILALPLIFGLVFFDILTFGFERLGISPEAALILLIAMLVGSTINIPLTRRRVEYSHHHYFGWFEIPVRYEYGLAINVGGALIPAGLSIYLLTKTPILPALLSTVLMTIICKFLTRPVPGRGLAISMFIPPLLATIFALLFSGEHAPAVAYISGVLGTLIGGDILNLNKARKLGAGIVSIGGAGVFDGIFLVGIFSLILTTFSLPFITPFQMPGEIY